MRNIDRFKSDLKRLIEEAERLELALFVQTHGAAEVVKALNEKITADALKKLPKFSVAYEAWYS